MAVWISMLIVIVKICTLSSEDACAMFCVDFFATTFFRLFSLYHAPTTDFFDFSGLSFKISELWAAENSAVVVDGLVWIFLISVAWLSLQIVSH